MASPPNSRRMRRSREAASAEKSFLSGFDLYGVQGDSAAALEVFREASKEPEDEDTDVSSSPPVSMSLAAKYNCLVLSTLTREKESNQQEEDDDVNVDLFLEKLEEMETQIAPKKKDPKDQIMVVTNKTKRNELILAYNRALVLQTIGENQQCASVCAEKLSDLMSKKEIPSEAVSMVASRLALLLLECILSLAVGKVGLSFAIQLAADAGGNDERDDGGGGDDNVKSTPATKIPPIKQILDWLELLNVEKDPQLKFLLQVYKSRVALADLDPHGKVADSHIRSARKDMKIAMEVFQNKLRQSFGGAETTSVVSSANSEELSSAGNSNRNISAEQQQQPPPPSSVVLQKLNQSALCLKAHLEQLKGNTKKSLILCSEAVTATTHEDDTAAYEALHSNNLAVVYETNNRRHLALHALAKSLRATGGGGGVGSAAGPRLFHKDGTARADPTLSVLSNAAVCALRAREYRSAYECLAACMVRSDTFRRRPRCWLRLAETCIGLFADLRSQKSGKKFSTVEVDDEPLGIVIESGLFGDNVGVTREELVAALGSPEDLEQVQRNPLLRARASLEHAIQDQDHQLEADALVSARLSLSYVYLAFAEPGRALAMAKLVDEVVEGQLEQDKEACPAVQRLRRRQAATARMYAAEASCALGELNSAMKFLVGDGKSDAFERMASDLSGVTMETASTNGKGKRRLARAQAMVRSSAGSVTAAMGNPAAKQLANSATAMEEAYLANRERSPARRALIYTLLREGNHATALSMLMSLR